MAKRISKGKPAQPRGEKEWENLTPDEQKRRIRETERRIRERQENRKTERQSLTDPSKLAADCEQWRRRIIEEADGPDYAYTLADAVWRLWDIVWPAMTLAGGVVPPCPAIVVNGNGRYASAMRLIHNGDYVLDLLNPTDLLEALGVAIAWCNSQLSGGKEDDGSGQADNKTDKGKKTLPDNGDVSELCRLLKKGISKGEKQIDIALQFTRDNRKKATNLLRQARRYRHLWQ